LHPAALASGIAALDVVIAGQAVYAVRRDDRRARRRNPAPPPKGDAR
jgi:hypothetical protein